MSDLSSLPPDFSRDKLQDRSYKAEDFNVHKDLAKGPSFDHRRCTDCLCFLIFWAFFGFNFYVYIYSYVNGNVSELLAPISGTNQICGYNETAGYDYLYIYDLDAASNSNDFFYYGVCVTECP